MRYYILITRHSWKKHDGVVELCRSDRSPIFDEAFHLASAGPDHAYQWPDGDTGFFEKTRASFRASVTYGVTPRMSFFDVDLLSLPIRCRTLFGQHFRMKVLPTLKRRTRKAGWRVAGHTRELDLMYQLLD